MEDLGSVAVAKSTEKLESEPFLLDIFQEGSCTKAIVEGAVEVLSEQIAICFGFDYSLVTKGIWDIRKYLPLTCTMPVSAKDSSTHQKGDSRRMALLYGDRSYV